MRHYGLAVIALILFSFPQIAQAEHPEKQIDGDQLQKKAEEILESEPGAKEVTVRVEVEAASPPSGDVIEFEHLDANHDGVFSRDEVGEALFKFFDGDGNQVIDNIEIKKPRLVVFRQMEKREIEIVDYYDAGKPTKRKVTQEEFMEASKLGRFDKDQDGLSPLDFLEMAFNQVNVKDDGVIDLYEWKRAYAASVRPAHMEDYNYNN